MNWLQHVWGLQFNKSDNEQKIRETVRLKFRAAMNADKQMSSLNPKAHKDAQDTKDVSDIDDIHKIHLQFIQESLGHISFYLQDDGFVTILCDWNDMSTQSAEKYGKMLHHIHNGNFAMHIVNILKSNVKEQPESQEFIKTIIDNWKNHYYDNDTEPMIKAGTVSQVWNKIHQDL